MISNSVYTTVPEKWMEFRAEIANMKLRAWETPALLRVISLADHSYFLRPQTDFKKQILLSTWDIHFMFEEKLLLNFESI